MNKLLGLIVIVALVTMSGCGGNDDPPPQTSYITQPDGTVLLVDQYGNAYQR